MPPCTGSGERRLRSWYAGVSIMLPSYGWVQPQHGDAPCLRISSIQCRILMICSRVCSIQQLQESSQLACLSDLDVYFLQINPLKKPVAASAATSFAASVSHAVQNAGRGY